MTLYRFMSDSRGKGKTLTISVIWFWSIFYSSGAIFPIFANLKFDYKIFIHCIGKGITVQALQQFEIIV